MDETRCPLSLQTGVKVYWGGFDRTFIDRGRYEWDF